MKLASISAAFLSLLMLTIDRVAAQEPLHESRSQLARNLKTVELPGINFRDAELEAALQFLARKVERHTKGAVKVSIVLDLPEDFRPQSELTLDLKHLPAIEAFRYLGELAGVQFHVDDDTLICRPRTAPAATETASSPKPKPKTTPVRSRSTHPLEKKPERIGGGNVHRAMDGAIQKEKSGYVPHRTLGGWPLQKGPANQPANDCSVNCKEPSKCGQGACGCKICACRKRSQR